MPRPPRHAPYRPFAARRGGAGDDRGFTLVEVLAAGTILSVVALSLVKAWAVFDGLSFDLMLRQKAVFVLSGEMERVWATYTQTSFGLNDTSRTDYPAIPGLPNSATRFSYPSNGITSGFVTASAATFADQATGDAVVFLGSGSPPQNWVWLDRRRNLVARLSWRICQFTLPDMHACMGIPPTGKVKSGTPSCFSYSGSGKGNCDVLTLILEYPYSFGNGTPQAVGTTRMLTLNTVVGRRA